MTGADEQVPRGRNVLRGTVRDIVYLGAATQVHVELAGGHTLTVEVANHDGPASVTHMPGTTVQCVCTPDAVRVLRRSEAAAPPCRSAAVSAGYALARLRRLRGRPSSCCAKLIAIR